MKKWAKRVAITGWNVMTTVGCGSKQRQCPLVLIDSGGRTAVPTEIAWPGLSNETYLSRHLCTHKHACADITTIYTYAKTDRTRFMSIHRYVILIHRSSHRITPVLIFVNTQVFRHWVLQVYISKQWVVVLRM